MKKTIMIVLLLIAVACIGLWIGLNWPREDPQFSTTMITAAVFRGQQYYLIPQALLDGRIATIDSKGTRYYIFSRETLQLMGEKLLIEAATIEATTPQKSP